MNKIFILKQDELEKICEIIPENGIILLKGTLASGKTTLTKVIAKHLGIKEEITSPTFSTMKSYENRFFHYDIYQEKSEGFLKQGLHENLTKEGIHIIEWGDDDLEAILHKMGFEYICIDISIKDKNSRYYEVYDAQA